MGIAAPSAGLSTERLELRGGHRASLRPAIYVYELPVWFNGWLHETRLHSHDCTYRRYKEGNTTNWENYAFGLELALHEVLLASPHRTLNPEAADFFFVPVYGGCYISRFFRPTPLHTLIMNENPLDWRAAPIRGNIYYRQALQWLRTEYPYWNRTGGRDHLFAFPHDEGACVAPIELQNATLLSSWGRLEKRPQNATTTMIEHSWFVPNYVKHMYASLQCYDPTKDILLPVFTSVKQIAKSPHLLPPELRRKRTILFHWRGQVLIMTLSATDDLPCFSTGECRCSTTSRATQHASAHHDAPLPPFPQVLYHFPSYSFGIRQQLCTLFEDQPGSSRWRSQGIVVSGKHSRAYLDEMMSSIFCGVFPGNGWGHIETPILLGCIPVVVQDAILTPWENVLDFSSYAIRIPRSDLGRIPQILRAVPEATISRMQRTMARVWERFTYSSLVLAERQRRCRSSTASARECEQVDLAYGLGAAAHRSAQYGASALQGHDAIDTLMHVLHARLRKREAEQAGS